MHTLLFIFMLLGQDKPALPRQPIVIIPMPLTWIPSRTPEPISVPPPPPKKDR